MSPLGTPPGPVGFHGRDQELDVLVAAFAACRSGHEGRSLVVHGEPGTGVSYLVRQLRHELRDRGLGHQWWSGRCTRHAPLPYEPMAGVLRAAPGDVAGWLAEADGAGGGEHAGVALLAGLARRIRTAAEVSPVVVVVDDIDGVDASTLRVLLGVLPLLDDVPVLVVLAGRTTVSGTAPHGLGERCDREIVVGPLDDDSIGRLVRSTVPEIDDDGVAAVVSAADGRPGVAAALAAAGDAERTLASLLTMIDPAAPGAVLAAGLADGWVDAGTLAGAVGVDVSLWQTLERRRVIAVSDRPAAGPVPTSDLWWAAARRAVGAQTRQLAHQVAPLLERGAPAAVVAAAWEQAADVDRACRSWERAGDEAAAAHAVETAAAALRRAIDIGGDDALVRLGRRAGEWSLAAGDRVEADTLAERLLPRLGRTDHVGQLAGLLLRYRARLEAGLTDHDASLDRALALQVPPCREHVDVLVVDALRRVLDEPLAAAGQAERALAEANELGDLAAIANAAGAAGLAAAIAGDLDGGLAHFDRALEAAATAGDVAGEARLASNRVFVLWRAGRPLDVERAAAAELDRLRVRGLSALGDQLAVGRCGALMTLGRLGEAADAIAAARTMKMAADPTAHLDLADATLALLVGEVDRAAMLVQRVATSLAGDLPEVVGERWVVASAVALARGDRFAAMEAATEGLRRCAPGDAIARWRLALAWWRSVDPADRADRADPAVTARPAGLDDLPSPVGAEQRALAVTIRAQRESSPTAWRAAIDAWSDVPAPLEALRCRLGAAIAAGDLDAIAQVAQEARGGGAVGLADEADTHWRSSGGRRAPKRTSGLLTERETEVLASVAEGLTNREVADRLYISVRTVGAHLERCMSKLGVGTRGAAVHEARRQGILPGSG